ncbi:MAG: hypothetical protein JWQ36_669 [Enterovirga sp.]|nr:hypothetical protein [Enterovirga sp.]
MRPDALHRHHRAQPTPPAAGGIVHLRRRTLIGAGLAATLALTWAGATTWYIASRDELAQRVFVRETEMRYAYEDRIAHLSAQIEREVTQNLVERRTVDARLSAVAVRQAEIEARQTWLRSAAEQAGLAGAAPAVTVRIGTPDAASASKRLPLPEVNLRLRNDGPDTDQAPRPRDRLSRIEADLERASGEEVELVRAVGRAARTRLTQIRSILDATGLDLAARTRDERAQGGPLVPVELKPGSGPIGYLFADLGASLAEIRRLDGLSRSLPLGQPLEGEAEQTSTFGTRFDPFTRGPALHTGLDFRAENGTPARATGPGRVVAAEYSGGYGNMVEIDHGNGVTTRYGHLARFLVAPGETVRAGQPVGLTGSTGRSTGPHLHYETRVAGEPVNPVRFLETGKLLPRADS